mgnify:CR=1 FL=1
MDERAFSPDARDEGVFEPPDEDQVEGPVSVSAAGHVDESRLDADADARPTEDSEDEAVKKRTRLSL